MIAMDLQLMLEGQGWTVLGPVGTVRDAPSILSDELPLAALLDVNLGNELITPVAEFLLEQGVPFAFASAYEKPEQFGGAVLAGAPNADKPTNERRLMATMALLTSQ